MSLGPLPDSLVQVAEEIRRCKLCPLWQGRNRAVPGEGPSWARCMFIGESPGREEDRSGRPFVGRSGKFLDSVLEDCGLKRESFFITGSVKCHPPGNRDPTRRELLSCRPYLDRQISIIEPEIIVLLGRVAIRNILGTQGRTEELRGQVLALPDHRVLPTFHPAAAIRFPERRRPFMADISSLANMLG